MGWIYTFLSPIEKVRYFLYRYSIGDSPLKYKQDQTIPKQTKLVVIPNTCINWIQCIGKLSIKTKTEKSNLVVVPTTSLWKKLR